MSAYSDKVIADGAVAYWRLDEASGNALSLVGNYPGTVSGGVTRSQPGALADGNTAMAFDGSTGKIAVAPAIAISAAFTVEAWIRTTGQAVQQPILATLAAAAGMYVGVKTGLPFLYITGSSGNPIGSTIVNDGLFHHVVFSNTGTNSNAYVDGQFVGTQAATHSADAALSVFIANGGPNFTNEFFIGAIDEVAIYPTALTPQQIAAHYALRLDTGQPAPYAAVYLPAADRPFNQWQPLTPSDQTDRPFASLWCGQAGTVAAVMQDGVVGSFTVPAGAIVPILGRRVNATGTSVTSILALGTV